MFLILILATLSHACVYCALCSIPRKQVGRLQKRFCFSELRQAINLAAASLFDSGTATYFQEPLKVTFRFRASQKTSGDRAQVATP